jgi:hypothetical protein
MSLLGGGEQVTGRSLIVRLHGKQPVKLAAL